MRHLISLIRRYDHQERLTALEAMEHAYFFPVIKEHSRWKMLGSILAYPPFCS